MSTEVGDGGPVRFTDTHSTSRSGRQLTFRSSGSAVVSASDLAGAGAVAGVRSAGSLSDRVTISIRGGAGGRFEENLVRTAAQACIQLTEGEVMEGRLRHNAATSLKDYLAVIARKTASLFAAGGKVAADLAGAPKRTIDTMQHLGNAVGMAFQMIDDLLDILGPEEKIGKPVGSDLRAGIPSLPVVLGVAANPELKAIIGNGTRLEGAALDRALKMLRDPKVVAEARAMAAEQGRIAMAALGELAPSVYRESLAALIDEQLRREV